MLKTTFQQFTEKEYKRRIPTLSVNSTLLHQDHTLYYNPLISYSIKSLSATKLSHNLDVWIKSHKLSLKL